MEANLTNSLKAADDVSIISFEKLFVIVETDLSEWKFYDDSLYESVLYPVTNVVPLAVST